MTTVRSLLLALVLGGSCTCALLHHAAGPAAGSGAQATTCVIVQPVWVDNQQVTGQLGVCLPV